MLMDLDFRAGTTDFRGDVEDFAWYRDSLIAVRLPVEAWTPHAAVEPKHGPVELLVNNRAVGECEFDVDASAIPTLSGLRISDPEFCGRGFGLQFLRLLTDFLCRLTNADALAFVVSADDAASNRIAQNAGFRYVRPHAVPCGDAVKRVNEWRLGRTGDAGPDQVASNG
jgi:RimJ/RimL family protein N-acetyltransferase